MLGANVHVEVASVGERLLAQRALLHRARRLMRLQMVHPAQ